MGERCRSGGARGAHETGGAPYRGGAPSYLLASSRLESTSAPYVVLVINDNISLVGLTLLSSMFQISSTMEWHGLKDVGTPSRC